ncbi:FAD binding domain-containing protein [Falsiroseomonas selenitidurans]|uniref:Xanthine dehydrogenase family protein subunit M n=1 Tax=Falsiroseomonas selenitidurans TaxID=2716335 RepID=A0ABX1EAL7_9PROT|nr:FAD binding domain-containing protein [Falsiroseomonas selenitidurans]NKC33868.1 xanthine dehydrogenase family protein subunit M [Falsiroseomonas selenitidurans]
MQPFTLARPASLEEATRLAAAGAMPLAGGTELLNWMRLGIAAPARLADISRLPGLDAIAPLPDGGLSLGALARLNDVAAHPAVRAGYPVLRQAIHKAASAQLRNLATIGGNLLQKTRCAYFRAEESLPCNRRAPGSGCAALHGLNERHAIFGWTEACVATQPSDPAVALAALDAVVVVAGPAGARRIPLGDLHLLPDAAGAAADTALRAGEIIVAIELPGPAPRSAYLKIRERESYEYALVSAAGALVLDGRTIRRARLALGSVAMKPWRLPAAEAALAGLSLDDTAALRAALEPAFAEARPLSHNGYKVPLARNAALRVIGMIAEGHAP